MTKKRNKSNYRSPQEQILFYLVAVGYHSVSQKLIILGMILFVLTMLTILRIPELHAQSQSFAKISGRITDASTGETLSNVNVFLAGTMRGDATDKDGQYIIENIPFGTYELVASRVGYAVKKIAIRFSDAEEKIIDFSLKSRILEGEEIIITAEEAKEWRENLKIFEKAFFGLKEFAKDCRFSNSEILDFSYDKTTGQFQAFATKPLQFINEALGYEVIFVIDAFKAKLYNGELYNVETVNPVIRSQLTIGSLFQKGNRQCIGTAHYKELHAQNEKEQRNWEKNRLIAYHGSLRHFLSALCAGRLKEEGFTIRGEKLDHGVRKEYDVKADTLLRMGTVPAQLVLSFSNYLKVTYKNEQDDIKYQIGMQSIRHVPFTDSNLDSELGRKELKMSRLIGKLELECAQQESWLMIGKGKSITIATNGIKIPGGTELWTGGYWSWDSAAEWLPIDYEPPQVEN